MDLTQIPRLNFQSLPKKSLSWIGKMSKITRSLQAQKPFQPDIKILNLKRVKSLKYLGISSMTLSWRPTDAGTGRRSGMASCCRAACRCPAVWPGRWAARRRHRCSDSMGRGASAHWPSTARDSGTDWKTRRRTAAGTAARRDPEGGSSTPTSRGWGRARSASDGAAAGGAAAAWPAVLCSWRILLETF